MGLFLKVTALIPLLKHESYIGPYRGQMSEVISRRDPAEPLPIEVTCDSRKEVVWLRFDALRIDALQTIISTTFGVPTDTTFVFKYQGKWKERC